MFVQLQFKDKSLQGKAELLHETLYVLNTIVKDGHLGYKFYRHNHPKQPGFLFAADLYVERNGRVEFDKEVQLILPLPDKRKEGILKAYLFVENINPQSLDVKLQKELATIIQNKKECLKNYQIL